MTGTDRLYRALTLPEGGGQGNGAGHFGDRAPENQSQRNGEQLDGDDQGDAGGPTASAPEMAGDGGAGAAAQVIKGDVQAYRGGAALLCGGADVTGARRIADEDAGAAEGQAENDHGQAVDQGEGDAGCPAAESRHQGEAVAAAVDPFSGGRRHDGADQVDHEEQPERGGGQRKWRRGEVEIDVGESAEQGEHDAEADGVGGQQARVAQVPPHGARYGTAAARTRKTAAGRKPGADGHRAYQVQRAQRDERPAPRKSRRHQRRNEAAAKAADHGAGDVGGSGGAGSGFPLFVDVGDGHGENTGGEDALPESPEEHLVVARGSGRQQRGDGQEKGRRYDDALAPQPVRHQTGERSGTGHRQGGDRHHQADSRGGDLKRTRQHRQQRLRRKQRGEGAEAGEYHGSGSGCGGPRRQRGHWFYYAAPLPDGRGSVSPIPNFGRSGRARLRRSAYRPRRARAVPATRAGTRPAHRRHRISPIPRAS